MAQYPNFEDENYDTIFFRKNLMKTWPFIGQQCYVVTAIEDSFCNFWKNQADFLLEAINCFIIFLFLHFIYVNL